MEKEPKIRITDSIKTIGGKTIILTEYLANVNDIKSAVEWLKNKIKNEKSDDDLIYEDIVVHLIDKAFRDVV